MKYIIVAKNEFEGNSKSDIANPLRVTEIATELVITRLRLLDLLQTGALSKEDCVVTTPERKCLYTKIFDNVMDYQEFLKIGAKKEDVTDLLAPGVFNQMSAGPIKNRIIPYKPFYQNWERDRDLITCVDWSSMDGYDLSKPFVALVVRKRAAWTEKNMSDEFWTKLIKQLRKNDIKTFVFGRETEMFCDSETVEYVKDYRDWCTLVKHDNCKHVGSTMTGGVYPLLIFGNKDAKMTIIDNTQLMTKHAGDPSFYDNCINFSKILIEFIKHIPSTEEFYGKITANI